MSERHLWMGGDCPVDPETVVEVEFRGISRAALPAGRLRWDRRGVSEDITSYRVIPEPALTGPDVNQSDPPRTMYGRAAAAFAEITGRTMTLRDAKLFSELLRMAEEAEKNG